MVEFVRLYARLPMEALSKLHGLQEQKMIRLCNAMIAAFSELMNSVTGLVSASLTVDMQPVPVRVKSAGKQVRSRR